MPRFQARLGRLQRTQDPTGAWKFIQKKVDVLLTVDLVRLSCEKQIQRAVLIAGDSDFVPAIQVARDAGTIVQLYHGSNPRPHDELLRVADDRIAIDDALIRQVTE
ncbi:MAG: NYN domain-containing protein [Planctomycetes bacterium]|nr:NYN domain-containing protein [Planctomycetota bacterium]